MKKIILISLLGFMFSQDPILTLDVVSSFKEDALEGNCDYNGGLTFGLEFPIAKKTILGVAYDVAPLRYLDSEINFFTLYGKYNFFKMGFKNSGINNFKIKLHPFAMIGINKGSSDESDFDLGISYGFGIYFPIDKRENFALSVDYKVNHYSYSDLGTDIDGETFRTSISLHFGAE